MAEEGLLGALVASVGLDLHELTAKSAEAKGEFTHLAEHGGSKMDALAGVGKVAFEGIGIAAIGVGAFSLKMADEFEEAHAQLEAAVENSGKKMEDFNKQIDAQGKTFEHLGYDNAQYQGALARLTQATNDPKKAMDDMGLVANIAAARHMDLTDAATLVGKVAEGNTGVLTRYGISINVAAGSAKAQAAAQEQMNKAQEKLTDVQKKIADGELKGKPAAEALKKAQEGVAEATKKVADTHDAAKVAIDALSERFEGNASKQADTFKGKMAELKANGEDWGKSIGMTLIPILIDLGTKVADVINYFQKHKTATEELAAVFVALLLPPLFVYVASMITAAAATIAATWPILAIMAALALLAAGLVYAYNHWGFFRNAVNGAVEDFKLGCAILSAGWKVFEADFEAGVDAIKRGWTVLTDDISTGAKVFEKGLSTIWDGLKSGAAAAFNWVIGQWNTFAKTMSIHGIPGIPDINIPQVAPVKFHQGGLVPGSPGQEVAAILQAGERVIPAGQAQSGAATPSSKLEVNINAPVYGVDDLTGVIHDAMKKHDRELAKQLRAGVGTR